MLLWSAGAAGAPRLLGDLFLQAAAGLEARDGGGLQLARYLGLGVGEVLGLALTHLKTAEARDGDLFAIAEHVPNGPEDPIHDLLDRGGGQAGVVGNFGNQLRSCHFLLSPTPSARRDAPAGRVIIANYYMKNMAQNQAILPNAPLFF